MNVDIKAIEPTLKDDRNVITQHFCGTNKDKVVETHRASQQHCGVYF